MKRLSSLVLGFGIVVAFLALTVVLALAQFPNPKDEAKLYELAKNEGTLIWYGASPLIESTVAKIYMENERRR
jgi:hypothetical protein